MHRSRRKFPVNRLFFSYSAASLVAVLALLFLPHPVRAQEPYQYESDLVAKRRLYSSVGAGFEPCADFLNSLFQLALKLLDALPIDPSCATPINRSPSFLEKLRREQMSQRGETHLAV